MSITRETIEALRLEALEAGDCGMVEVCDVALGRDWIARDKPSKVARERAIDECERVIAHEKAQR